jgi:TPR repeat protein
MRDLQPERRQTIRKTPEQFAFLQVERDDGGSVLDVSEGGLQFETFAPVPDRGPVHLWFSLNMQERIEAWGEVVWTNGTKKRGGLRFLGLSEGGREQICDWLYRPVPQPMRITEEDYLRRRRVSEMPLRAGAEQDDVVARFVAKARPQAEEYAVETGSTEGIDALYVEKEERKAPGELVPVQRFLSVKRRQLVLGVLLGMVITGGLTVGAMKFMDYRQQNLEAREAREAVIAQPRPNVANEGATTPQNNLEREKTGYAPQRSTGSAYPDLGVTRARTSGATPGETGGHAVSRGTDPALGNAPMRTTLPPADESVSRLKTSKTPQQLWAAVQAGNSNAAVALAEFYIKGEGVPQNCSQARVLLLVASEKNNATAIKRLSDLDKTGCPGEQ